MTIRCKLGLFTLVTLGLLATGLGLGWGSLMRAYQLRQFQQASEPSLQTRWARDWLAGGPAGERCYLQAWEHAPAPTAAALALAFTEWSATAEPQALSRVARGWLERSERLTPAGRAQLLDFLPECLRTDHPEAAAIASAWVVEALQGADLPPERRVVAVLMAAHPQIRQEAKAVVGLNDPAPAVRLQTLLSIATPRAGQPDLIPLETLFSLLHDGEPEVRTTCQTVLEWRGLNLEQIDLGRQLTHPEAAERLALLNELAQPDTIRNPAPWLEWLSRDASPAVRLGAARVALERQVQGPWLLQLAETDPEPAVRDTVRFYVSRWPGVLPAGHIHPPK